MNTEPDWRQLCTQLAEALREIAKGAGPFSRDPLTHATATIESMKADARKAIAAYDLAMKVQP